MDVKKYTYFFESKDENGEVSPFFADVTDSYKDMTVAESCEQLVSFLGQTNPSYLDKYGIVHEEYEGKDQPYAYIFEVQDDDFYEAVGTLGQYLDEHSDEYPQEDSVRKAIEEVYNRLLPIAEGKEEIAGVDEVEPPEFG